MFINILMFSFFVVSVLYTVAYLPTLQLSDASVSRNVPAVSDDDLQNISEKLFNESSHELYKYVSVSYQGKITSRNFTDNAPDRLLNVSSEVFLIPSVQSMIKLFDNYELNTYEPETRTEEEYVEESEFVENIVGTNTILRVMDFLSIKGFFANNLQVYKEVLHRIWFHPYSRSKGVNGSSGFEHVFVLEKKPRKGIIGLHNWIFFFLQELEYKINYLGFMRNIEFANKAAIAQIHFNYNGKQKMSSIFIGTAPDLEIAIYTLCFFTRPNKKCKVSFAGKRFGIQTYVSRNNGEALVGTAFPLI